MTETPKAKNVGDFGPHVPEDKVQYLVETPYGRGLTIRTRKATPQAPRMRQIELLDWKQAAERSRNATKNKTTTDVVKPQYLYSTADFPSVDPKVGDEVMCTFGRGKVTDIRAAIEDTTSPMTVAVSLSSWRLARRSRVSLYLQPTAVRVVRPHKIYEMNVHERVDAALAFKEEAAAEFAAKNYQAALQSYAKAIDAVRYVQHKTDSDNYIRADLLVVMVTCTNNAGMCARHLGKWEESYDFGRNAQVLLDAMKKKKGMKIHTILVKDGYPDVKTFGEWKVKSLMLQARALTEKQELENTVEILKEARTVISAYATPANAEKYAHSVKTLRNLEKEALKLLTMCKERRSFQLKKEKERAAAMFSASSEAPKANRENLNPAEHEEERGISGSKDKENLVPNGLPSDLTPSLPPRGVTLPLKSKPDDDEEPKEDENKGGKFKRRVSFSEKVTSYELPRDEDIKYNKMPKEEEEAENLPWYKDPEALLGAAIFGTAVFASSLIVSTILRKRS